MKALYEARPSNLSSPLLRTSLRNPLLRALEDAQARQQFIPPAAANPSEKRPTVVVVGVSGGADSVCLLHALTQLAAHWHCQLHVAHLDHALRPESTQEAAFVAQLAATWQLPYSTQRLTPGALAGQPGGLEAAARQARYHFLAQIAINVTPLDQVPLLAVAHHADDQAETVLLNLLRGSGVRGLGGMRWKQPWQLNDETAQTVQVIRPLLGTRKEEILRYLQAHRLVWCEDTSNRDTTFLRNRLRYELLPLLTTVNPQLVETLGRTAQVLTGEADRLEELDQQALRATQFSSQLSDPLSGNLDALVLDLSKLLALSIAEQRGLLRQAVIQLLASPLDMGFAEVDELLRQLMHHPHASGPHPLPHGLAWSVAGATAAQPARLSLHRAAALPFAINHPWLGADWRASVVAAPVLPGAVLMTPNGWQLVVTQITPAELPADWRSVQQGWRTFLDADQLGQPVVTTLTPGLRFAPLGLAGHHKALGDFFTDHKVPVALRAGWPLLVDQRDGELLWLCGLRPSHRARITDETCSVLSLTWQI